MTGTSLSRQTLATWAAIVLGITYLVAAGGGGFFGLYVIQFRIASVLVVVAAILIWFVVALQTPSWRPQTQFGPSMLAAIGTLAVCLLAAVQPRFGADYLAYAVLLAVSYVILHRLVHHPVFGPRLGLLALLLGFSLCGLYSTIVLFRWIEFWDLIGRIVPPPLRPGFEGLAYGNPSTVATVGILLWLASAAHLGVTSSRARAIVVILGVLVAWVVFVSGSRGAWVGLAIAAAVLVPAWLSVSSNRATVRELLRSRWMRLGGIAGLIGGAVVGAAFLPALVSRITEPAAETRTAFYATAMRMFWDDPLKGVGPGTWVAERIRFTQAPELDYYIPHAHNIVLQTMAELGILGLVTGLIILVALGRITVRAIRSGDPTRRRFGWAAFAASVYLLAHQMFDFYPNMPAVGFLFALIVARIDLPGHRVMPGPRRTVALLVVIAVAVAVSTAWLARSESIALTSQQATEAANAGDGGAALALAGDAARADPDMPPYLFALGLAAASAGDKTVALDAMRASAELDDYPTAWLNVARLELDRGGAEAARGALTQALRLGYQDVQVAFGAASIYLELGDVAPATRAAAAALVDAPGLASDPFWRAHAAWRAIVDSAVDLALVSARPEIGYHLALEAGLPARATEIVAALPDGSRHVPELVARAWSGEVAAFEELHRLAKANPLDDETVAMCRRVAARSHDGDWTGAGPWDCDGAGIPAALIIVRVGPPPTSRNDLPNTNSSWHFQYAYRRTVPHDQLVPGIPHLRARVV